MYIDSILALGPAARAGLYSAIGFTRDSYMKRLKLFRFITIPLYFVERREPIRSTHTRILNLIEALKLDKPDGTLRKQPFCVHLSGPPGTSKTTLAIQIAQKLMRAKYGRALPSDIVTLNETDDFQSEYRSDHKVVIFDDLGAESFVASNERNPWRKVLDFVNNVRKTALNPAVEMKGIVQIEPEVVIITSNVGPARIDGMVCPWAFYRRMKKRYFIGALCYPKRIRRIVDDRTMPLKMSKHAADTDSVYRMKSGMQFEGNHEFQSIGNEAFDPTCSYNITDEEMMEEILTSFLEHDADQDQFVARINAGFDSPDETPTYFAHLHQLSFPGYRWSRFKYWDYRVRFQMWCRDKFDFGSKDLDLSAESSTRRNLFSSHSLVDDLSLDTLSFSSNDSSLSDFSEFPEIQEVPTHEQEYCGILCSHSEMDRDICCRQLARLTFDLVRVREDSTYHPVRQLFQLLPAYNARQLMKDFELEELSKIVALLRLSEIYPDELACTTKFHQPFDSCKVIVAGSFLINFEKKKLSFCKFHFNYGHIETILRDDLVYLHHFEVMDSSTPWSSFLHNGFHIAFIADTGIPEEHIKIYKKFYFLYRRLWVNSPRDLPLYSTFLDQSKRLNKILKHNNPSYRLISSMNNQS
jgi:hypothetical protein